VSTEDARCVWAAMGACVSAEERAELLAGGEMVLDEVTGELRRALAQGPALRLIEPPADPSGDLACLDWPFFLAEISRLQSRIAHVASLPRLAPPRLGPALFLAIPARPLVKEPCATAA